MVTRQCCVASVSQHSTTLTHPHFLDEVVDRARRQDVAAVKGHDIATVRSEVNDPGLVLPRERERNAIIKK